MKRYEVEINGVATTLQLSEADAKARGLIKDDSEPGKPAAKEKTPANKSRTTANKSVSTADAKRAEAASQAFGAKKG